jgi:GNAT superfamily N-acetyltransferase
MTIDVCSISDVKPELVADFANRTWGEARAKLILSEWWINSSHAETMVAFDTALDRIAGIVVAVKSSWRLSNRKTSSTVSICGWYVAPEYAGQGLGRLLVKRFDKTTTSRNTVAITENAIQAFKKLGWSGPHGSQLFLLPLPLFHQSNSISDKFSFESYNIVGDKLPIELQDALNKIEHDAPLNLTRRVRSAEAWCSHLSVWPKRRRSIYIITLHGKAIGAFSIRDADKQAAAIYRYARLSYVTDIIMNEQSIDCLSYIASVIISSAKSTAGGLVLCTSNVNFANTLTNSGWWSEKTMLIGKKIAAKSPLYMLDGELAKISNENLDITFSDSDIDLNL